MLMVEKKKDRENKLFKEEFSIFQHSLSSDTGQGSSNGNDNGFKWFRRANGTNGKAHLAYHMLLSI